MRLFLFIMAVFSRILPGKASDTALKLMTSPRPPSQVEGDVFPVPEKVIAVGSRASLQIWPGGSRRVLLVHGWSGHWSQFSALMAHLGRDAFSFYALQMPGHGSERDGVSHVGEFITALRQALEVMGEPVEVLIGHSMGASAAAFVLSERGDIGKTVLIAPPTDFHDVVNRMATNLRFGERARQQLLDKMASRVGIGYDALNIVRRGPLMTARVLLVHDSDDREVPFTDSLKLYQSLPAASLHQTVGKGHRRVLADRDVLERVAGFARDGVLTEKGPDVESLRVPA